MDGQPYTPNTVSVADTSTGPSYPSDSSVTAVYSPPTTPVVTAAFPGVGGIGYVLMQVPSQLLSSVHTLPATMLTHASPPLPALTNSNIQNVRVEPLPTSVHTDFTNAESPLSSADSYYQNPMEITDAVHGAADDYGQSVDMPFSDNFPQYQHQNVLHDNAPLAISGDTNSAPFLNRGDPFDPLHQPFAPPTVSSTAALPGHRPRSEQPYYMREYIRLEYPASEAPSEFEICSPSPSPPRRGVRAIRYRNAEDGAQQQSPIWRKREPVSPIGKQIEGHGSYYVSDGHIVFDPPIHLGRNHLFDASPPPDDKVLIETPPEIASTKDTGLGLEPESEPKFVIELKFNPVLNDDHGPELESEPRQQQTAEDVVSLLSMENSRWIQTPREWIKDLVTDQSIQTPCGWEGGASVIEGSDAPDICAGSCPTARDLGIRKKKRKKLCCSNCKEAHNADKSANNSENVAEQDFEQHQDTLMTSPEAIAEEPGTESHTPLEELQSEDTERLESESQNQQALGDDITSQTSKSQETSETIQQRRASTSSSLSENKRGKRYVNPP